MNTRRQFLIRAPLGFLDRGRRLPQRGPRFRIAIATPATPGAPPTFGTGTGSGPAVSPATFAEAEKLMQVTMTAAERQQAADSWRQSLAPYLERRTGPRKVAIAATDAPATLWNPMLPGIAVGPAARPVRSLEGRRRAAAFVGRRHRLRAGDQLSRWIESRQAHVRAAHEHLSRSHRAARRRRSAPSSRSPGTTRSRARRRPTPRSPRANTAARCTAFRTA